MMIDLLGGGRGVEQADLQQPKLMDNHPSWSLQDIMVFYH